MSVKTIGIGQYTKTTLFDNNDLGLDRRVGHTTRQVDYAIQLLFQGEVVKVLDHWKGGTIKEANKYLFDRILNRLNLEHRHVMRGVVADIQNLIIRLDGRDVY